VLQPRRIRLTGHVAGMEEKADVNRVLVEIPEGKKPLEDLSVDGKIIK